MGVQTLSHEVLRELVGYGADEGLVVAAGVVFLAEDASEAAEQVLSPVLVSVVLCVANDALQHFEVFLATLEGKVWDK